MKNIKSKLLSIASVLTLVVYSVPSFAGTTAFSDTYQGSGSGAACDTSYAISGVMPDDGLPHPVFVYLVGTTEAHDNGQADAAIAGMAARGFVAASVQYRSETFGNCAEIAQKAACVFKPRSAESAVSKLCARGSCAKGIVVGGFSQGAVAAVLAKNTDKRVKAAYGMGALASYGTFNLSSCMNNRKHSLASKNLRIVNGEKDEFGGGAASSVRILSEAVTGKKCGNSATSCLNTNGSGWVMVRNSQVRDKAADHCYQRASKGCAGNPDVVDSVWKSGKASWTLRSNLNWLQKFAKP